MKIETIKFEELSDISDDHLVMTGLLLTEEEYRDTIKAMNEYFNEHGVYSGSIVSLKRITGNVLGDKGRWDWLMTFNPENKINPIKRLSIGDMKWPSDFIVNYAKDYGVDITDEEDSGENY